MTPSGKFELIAFHDDIFSLLIKTVDRDDGGRYTCLAKNEYGEAKSEALLNVVGELAFRFLGIQLLVSFKFALHSDLNL